MNGGGLELNVLNVLLASLPVLILVVGMLALKWTAPRAGALSWLVAGILALAAFGANEFHLAIASSKGLSLSFFVLTIIWTSVLLYNVIDQMDGIKVIGATMTRLVRDPLAQALVVGWGFGGLMQGVAGFGLPVAVVAPLLVMMRFSPANAAAIALVGHSWAVTFGSLGSSYYTIQLVSGLPGEELGPTMAAMFALPTIATGFAVAHLQGGFAAMRRGALAILIMGGVMSLALWATALLGAYQIASVVAALAGCGVGWMLSRTPLLAGTKVETPLGQTPVPAQPVNSPVKKQAEELAATVKSPRTIGFHMAFLPYYMLFLLSVLSQLPFVKEFGASLQWGLDYPAFLTGDGFQVAAQADFARINLLSHPAPLILASLAVSYAVYRLRGVWKRGIAKTSVTKTYSQVISNSVGVGMMVMMALVMTDTGMTALLGETIARGTGSLFPVFSPYIGVLGTFMTGSNTNSNAMFGALQMETAAALGVTPVIIAAAQSIGGSLGSSIAMSKVMAGTVIVGMSGREREVLIRAIPYCLILVLLVGIQAWVILNLF